MAASAAALGGLIALPDSECTRLTTAGYLHDIGKLSVPLKILEKPAALDEREIGVIRHHSRETFKVLNLIFTDNGPGQSVGVDREYFEFEDELNTFLIVADKIMARLTEAELEILAIGEVEERHDLIVQHKDLESIDDEFLEKFFDSLGR